MNTFKNNLRAELYYDMYSDHTVIWLKQLVVSADAATRLAAWPTCDATHTFNLTLMNPSTRVFEIVKCTSVSANEPDYIVFNVSRAQEGSVAIAHGKTTTTVENRLTAAALTAIVDAIASVTATVTTANTRLDTLDANVSGLANTILGSIQSVLATNSYVPAGCVPANGAEYTRTQFPTLYDTYLAGGKFLTCTYAEFSTQVAASGNCAKFAIDTATQKFKVPMLKDGDSITQASSTAELGKSYKAGLPNITGSVYIQGLSYGSAIVSSGALYAGDSGFGNGVPSVVPSNGCSTIGFNAAGSSPIYGNATTVRDEQVRLRHFVVVASAQNNASVFDWSNYMAGLAGKASIDFNNITLTGKVNAGKAMAYALDYAHPVTFAIGDTWTYVPVGGLMIGWLWMDPAAPAASGVITVGSTQVAGVVKGEGASTVSCFIDLGVGVKKAVGMHAEAVVIVPWRTA